MLDINDIFSSGKLFDGRYKLLKLLSNAGGSADVWLAIDVHTIDDTVDESKATQLVIKIYRPKNIIDGEGEFQFRQEFRKVFGCHHENIIQPTYFSVYEEMPYLVMPYCKAGSSEHLVGKLKNIDLWKYISDVASGLAYLHSLTPQLIHQDIKPANVLIDDNGNYAITDFGISAKSGGSENDINDETGGTFAYMAPERFVDGTPPMPESDIWAFGATLYELITGDTPFGNDGGCRQSESASLPPIKEDVPTAVKELIYACLAYDPTKRPSARAIVDTVMRKRYSKNKKTIAFTVVLTLVVAVGLTLFFAKRHIPEPDSQFNSLMTGGDSIVNAQIARILERGGATKNIAEDIVGNWLMATSTGAEWATYEFSASARVNANIYENSKLLQGTGFYWIDDSKDLLSGNYKLLAGNTKYFKWIMEGVKPFEITVAVYNKDQYVMTTSLYRILSTVDIEAGVTTEINFKALCGTDNISELASVDAAIASVTNANEVMGHVIGSTFLTFKTSNGYAALIMNVTPPARTFAELVVGTWIYDNLAEKDWQRTIFVADNLVSVEWLPYYSSTIVEKASGEYKLVGNDCIWTVSTDYGASINQKWITEKINQFDWTYTCYNDNSNVGKYTGQRLLGSVALRPGETFNPEYKKLTFGYEISGYDVHNAQVATVDADGAITAVAKGRTYVDVQTTIGTGVFEVNVEQ